MKYAITLNVNGEDHEVKVDPYDRLADVLRDKLGLTGTKRGCDYGGCGCCTVNIDGKAVYSCMFPALKAVGKHIVTIEGLSSNGILHPIQEAFLKHGGFQCGYCTPGMMMSAKALLERNKSPTEEEVRDALDGNLCRCTGYVKIVEAVLEASSTIRQSK